MFETFQTKQQKKSNPCILKTTKLMKTKFFKSYPVTNETSHNFIRQSMADTKYRYKC